MAVTQEIRCSHSGAPVEFRRGEMIATCRHCGYTTATETGRALTFGHSLLLNKYDYVQIEVPIKDWMSTGFLKPPGPPGNKKSWRKP